MGKFFGTRDGIKRDELCGGAEKLMSIRNIEVAQDAEIKRGMLLCSATTYGVFAPVTSTGDGSKVLVIAEKDFAADSDHTVTQAYTSGKFNREKIILKSGLNIDAFEEPLRKVEIMLASIKTGVINIDEWQIGNTTP